MFCSSLRGTATCCHVWDASSPSPSWLYRGLSAKIPQAGKSEFYSLLGIWGDFRECLRGLGLSPPLSCRVNPCSLKITHCLGWGKGSSLQWKQSWPVSPSAGENHFHKHTTFGSGPIYSHPGSHQGQASACATPSGSDFAFEMWFYCPIAAWYHPAHSTVPWCPKK